MNNRVVSLLRIIGAGAVFALLSACDPQVIKTFDEGHSVVFGRVKVTEDGKEQDNMYGIGGGEVQGPTLVLLRPHQKNADMTTMGGNGEFYWDLGPGEYSVIAFQFHARGGRRSIPLNAKFSVPASPTAVYIGDLAFSVNEGRYSLGVEDHFEAAKGRLSEAHPVYPAAFSRDLMALEQPIGSFSLIVSACAPIWTIECKRHQYGVAPIRPSHTTGGYTEAGSLTPTFHWTSAERPNIHYDLIVRKAVSTDSFMLLSKNLPGEMVYYKEDLVSPSHTLESPLAPDTEYLWSVRFRQNDVVSAWSSAGHFAFFLVGYSSGSGEWFRFRTPASD